ncbi:MAG: TonB family protein [Novosphingobium sp.]|nr:TonB family protein [Novosphingobium sp.]
MTKADLTAPRQVRLAVVLAGIVFHILLVIGLLRAFTPGFSAAVVDQIAAVLTVTITTPEPARTDPEKQGAAAPVGEKAKPRPESAPKPEIVISENQAPPVASTGNENQSGAKDQGEGTGAGGEGLGTGAGGSGTGPGGGAVQKLEKIAGDINSARDYPKANRKLRNGNSVIIQMTVGTNGRASNCRIITGSPDAEADKITCRLAVERFRFRPRTNAAGTPIPGEYRWRQKWWDPRD